MKSSLFAVVCLACGLLSACDQQAPQKPPVPHVDDPKPAVLFQDQRNALDKAKGVNGQMEEQAQHQREATEQEGK